MIRLANTLVTWVPPFATARRNFPTDTDGTNRIWLSGGYGSDGDYCLGLDGNLHLPRESLWVAFANTHGDCNRNGYCIGNAPLLPQRLLLPRRRGLRRRPGRVPHRRLGRKVCFSSHFFGDSRSTRESPLLALRKCSASLLTSSSEKPIHLDSSAPRWNALSSLKERGSREGGSTRW